MDDGAASLVEISTKEGYYPKKKRVGYYDTSILCQACEDNFGKYDDAGQHVLIKREHEFEKILDDQELKAYRLDNVNGEKFKRFLVSVLWRASVSTLPQFSMVNLGPHEARAKAISWGDAFSSSEEFAFLGTKYIESEVSDLFLNPHRLRNAGINFVNLFFPGYSFWIKVDNRTMPRRLSKFNIVDTELPVILDRSRHPDRDQIP